ncbi:MAG: hypothetical protein RIB98_16855 [Acidimicrobiales bacterium]
MLTDTRPTAPSEAPEAPSGAVRWLEVVAVLVLVLAVALLGDPSANSGSDAGGKLATVENISDQGLSGVDLGYWASDADPLGDHHPFYNTTRTSQGWIQATSAVMPSISSAGSRVGGDLGALALSLLAVPVGALAAAALARQLGAPTGRLAFWVIGAASPLTFYGTDQWEHAPALAVALWTVVLIRRHPTGRQALITGALFGLAFILRRETGALLALVWLSELARPELRRDRRELVRHLVAASIAGVACLGIAFATYQFDKQVLGQSLGGRSLSQAGSAGSDLGERLHDGVLTTISLYTALGPAEIVMSLGVFVGLALAALGWRRDDESLTRIGIVLAAACVAIRVVLVGTGFVPGAFAALPLAAAAPVLARRDGRRLVILAALAVVAVVATQWTGSLAAQWGGRYLLLPAAVMAVVASAEFERRDLRHPAAVAALACTVAIAALGLVWHVERTNGIADIRDGVLEIAGDDIVISANAHFPREVAADVLDRRWLRADRADDVVDALAVARQSAPGETVWLLHRGTCDDEPCGRRWNDAAGHADLADWTSGSVHAVPWLGAGTYVLEELVPA